MTKEGKKHVKFLNEPVPSVHLNFHQFYPKSKPTGIKFHSKFHEARTQLWTLLVQSQKKWFLRSTSACYHHSVQTLTKHTRLVLVPPTSFKLRRAFRWHSVWVGLLRGTLHSTHKNRAGNSCLAGRRNASIVVRFVAQSCGFGRFCPTAAGLDP